MTEINKTSPTRPTYAPSEPPTDGNVRFAQESRAQDLAALGEMSPSDLVHVFLYGYDWNSPQDPNFNVKTESLLEPNHPVKSPQSSRVPKPKSKRNNFYGYGWKNTAYLPKNQKSPPQYPTSRDTVLTKEPRSPLRNLVPLNSVEQHTAIDPQGFAPNADIDLTGQFGAAVELYVLLPDEKRTEILRMMSFSEISLGGLKNFNARQELISRLIDRHAELLAEDLARGWDQAILRDASLDAFGEKAAILLRDQPEKTREYFTEILYAKNPDYCKKVMTALNQTATWLKNSSGRDAVSISKSAGSSQVSIQKSWSPSRLWNKLDAIALSLGVIGEKTAILLQDLPQPKRASFVKILNAADPAYGKKVERTLIERKIPYTNDVSQKTELDSSIATAPWFTREEKTAFLLQDLSATTRATFVEILREAHPTYGQKVQAALGRFENRTHLEKGSGDPLGSKEKPEVNVKTKKTQYTNLLDPELAVGQKLKTTHDDLEQAFEAAIQTKNFKVFGFGGPSATVGLQSFVNLVPHLIEKERVEIIAIETFPQSLNGEIEYYLQTSIFSRSVTPRLYQFFQTTGFDDENPCLARIKMLREMRHNGSKVRLVGTGDDTYENAEARKLQVSLNTITATHEALGDGKKIALYNDTELNEIGQDSSTFNSAYTRARAFNTNRFLEFDFVSPQATPPSLRDFLKDEKDITLALHAPKMGANPKSGHLEGTGNDYNWVEAPKTSSKDPQTASHTETLTSENVPGHKKKPRNG